MISGEALLSKDVSNKIKSFVQRNINTYQEKSPDNKELKIINNQLFEYIVSLGIVTQEFIDYWVQLHVDEPEPLHLLAIAAEYNDSYIGPHLVRMSRYSALLAEKMGLDAPMIENIKLAVPMHDIGKVGIPDEILLKPGKLSDQEFDLIKDHTVMGANLLASSTNPLLWLAAEIASSHHEKWDGSGYPLGLSGDEIPLIGQIVGLLDVFEAITSVRPYKPVYPDDVAWDYINIESGDHFSPEVVEVFLKHFDELIQIKDQIQ